MLNQEQIDGKWDEIKGGVRNLWGKLTDDDLESTNHNLEALPSIVYEKYGESKESIKHKLRALMESFDNETDKSLKVNDGISSFERDPTKVRTSQTSQLQDMNEDMRTRSSEREAFENSEGAAINTKENIAGNEHVDLSSGLSSGAKVEDRLARH